MIDRYGKQGGNNVARGNTLQFNRRRDGRPLRVLSEKDWESWQRNGYVVIPRAVPRKNLDAMIDLLWEFQEMDPDDPATWSRKPLRRIEMAELNDSGMVEIYHHQAMWENRQYQRVYEAFVDIWGTEKLWVTIDRANLNLPNSDFKGFIHWDIDTSLDPLPINVQGVLALNDATADMGGFQCVPDLYRNLSDWARTQPADRDPFKPDITGFEIVKLEMEAGDLLIWNSQLPHGIRPNLSDKPRLAQYIAMVPAQEDKEDLREWRIRSWRDRVAPEGYAFPGDPRQWEQTRYQRAALTDLGEKLLGLKRW
jgi:hypothetical protein